MSPPIFSLPLLAFDTGGDQLLVTVAAGGDYFTTRYSLTHGQAEELLPAIKKTLTASGVDMKEIRTILVTLGPGSFTGLRVGVSAAIGFAVGLGFAGFAAAGVEGPAIGQGDGEKIIYGIGSLPAMLLTHLARHDLAAGGEDFLVLADSRREEIFYQPFHVAADKDSGQKEITPLMAEPAMAVEGELVKKYRNEKFVKTSVDFETILRAGGVPSPFLTRTIAPIYARPADTAVKK